MKQPLYRIVFLCSLNNCTKYDQTSASNEVGGCRGRMGPCVWGLSSPFPLRKQSCMWNPWHKLTSMCRNMWEHTCDCLRSYVLSLARLYWAFISWPLSWGGNSPCLFACCSGFMPLALFTLEDVGVYYPYSTTMPSGHKLKSGRWRRSNDGCIIRNPQAIIFLTQL